MGLTHTSENPAVAVADRSLVRATIETLKVTDCSLTVHGKRGRAETARFPADLPVDTIGVGAEEGLRTAGAAAASVQAAEQTCCTSGP